MTTSLGFAGDVMLGRGVDRRQRRGSRAPVAVWGDVLDRLRALDGLVVNLESPLSERGTEWTETDRTFHFRASPGWATPALDAASIDCCALANNHALDFGEVALEDTLAALDDVGIEHAGAGHDADAARDPATFAVDGLDVAVVAFTDNAPEYAAEVDSVGTAYIRCDPDDAATQERVHDALSRARVTDPDLLVASVHLGPNMVDVPAEKHARFARWLAERGVDVVHGHSAHVFQGVEVHDGSLILHDTGDFVDDYAVDETLRNDRSFLFELRLDADGLAELRLHPVEIYDCAVHETTVAASWCRKTMQERSGPFGTAERFEQAGDALVLPLD